MSTASEKHNRNAEKHSLKVWGHIVFLVANADHIGIGATTFNMRAAARRAKALEGHVVLKYAGGKLHSVLKRSVVEATG